LSDLFPRQRLPPRWRGHAPQSLAEVVGQPHLLGPGKPLRLAFESGKAHSMILWGPPGVARPRWRA